MTDALTTYDIVAYPSVIHHMAWPERLAVAARLAGLDPAPIDEARVLEIGGGTCLGLIAFAAAHPGCDAHGFDLASTAIARARELAGQACPNVSLEVDDILAAKSRYAPRSFDYVIAHGVYAWVPGHVRTALLDLVSHVLSERGVAFVSYNALPGGHIRRLIREMLLFEVAGLDDAAERARKAASFLQVYSQPREGDSELLASMRKHAKAMHARSPQVLFHDELGPCFEPQSLTDVATAADAVGLRFLADLSYNCGLDGFLPDDIGDIANPDEVVLRLAQSRDYLWLNYFRATLLVHEQAPIDRRLDPRRIDSMFVSAKLQLLEDGRFANGDTRFTISDPQLAEAIRGLAKEYPMRRPLSELVHDDERRRTLLKLYRFSSLEFHLGPEPFAKRPGPSPETGRWIRSLLLRGEREIHSLAAQTMTIDQPELRALLLAADGTRTIAELAEMDHGIPGDQVEAALASAAERALLVR